jgi:hypothetical protein
MNEKELNAEDIELLEKHHSYVWNVIHDDWQHKLVEGDKDE